MPKIHRRFLHDSGGPKKATAAGLAERALPNACSRPTLPNIPLALASRHIKPGTCGLSKIFIYFSATQEISAVQFYQQSTFWLTRHLCLM